MKANYIIYSDSNGALELVGYANNAFQVKVAVEAGQYFESDIKIKIKGFRMLSYDEFMQKFDKPAVEQTSEKTEEEPKTLADIFEQMDATIEKFKTDTQKIFDEYRQKMYDIEKEHKKFMLRLGGKE